MKHLVFYSLILLLFFNSCQSESNSNSKDTVLDYKFEKYISAYTNGIISKRSNLLVVFRNNSFKGIEINKLLENNPFSITPAVEGKVKWTNLNTLEFIPDELLPSDKKFEVTLDLQLLDEKIPDSLSRFMFSFKTRKQHISLTDYQLSPMSSTDLSWQSLTGKVSTNDFENIDDIERYLKIIHENKEYAIKWNHLPEINSSTFSVDSIPRTLNKSELKIIYNASHLNLDSKGELMLQIPGLGDFEVLSVKGYNYPDQYVEVQFSDPISTNQNIEGLVRIAGQKVTFKRSLYSKIK